MERGVRGGSNGVNVDHGDGAETPRTMKAPLPGVPNVEVIL
jgi:hypothetical protein